MKYIVAIMSLFFIGCANLPFIGGSAVPVKQGDVVSHSGYLGQAKLLYLSEGQTVPYDGIFYSRETDKVEVTEVLSEK